MVAEGNLGGLRLGFWVILFQWNSSRWTLRPVNGFLVVWALSENGFSYIRHARLGGSLSGFRSWPLVEQTTWYSLAAMPLLSSPNSIPRIQ